MKNIAIALSMLSGIILNAQHLIKYDKIDHLDLQELQNFWVEKELPEFITSVKNEIDVYELYYYTALPDGKKVMATGLYFVPLDYEDKVATMLYNHTAFVQRREGTAYDNNGETSIAKFFSADGYAVAWQDYIGLGKGEGFHPYQHLKSEGQSGVDLLRAIEELNSIINFEVNDQLFVTGYSQGGHATLGVHKMIQEEFSDEFRVTASSPMSGNHDVSGVQNLILDGQNPKTDRMAHLMYGYQKIYKIFPNEEQFKHIFKPEYTDVIEELLAKGNNEFSLENSVPDLPEEMLKPHIYNIFKNDPDFLFTKKMKENDNYKWVPESPVQFCYCKGDDQVYYKNSIVAMEWMKEHGAKHVYDRMVSELFNHGQCADFAIIYTKLFFDSFRNGHKKGKDGNVFKTLKVKSMVKEEEKKLGLSGSEE
jgi:hypothetical protein